MAEFQGFQALGIPLLAYGVHAGYMTDDWRHSLSGGHSVFSDPRVKVGPPVSDDPPDPHVWRFTPLATPSGQCGDGDG